MGKVKRAVRADQPRPRSNEVVIKLDQRFLLVILGVVALVVALLVGIAVGLSTGGQSAAVPAAQFPPGANQPGLVMTVVPAPSIPGLNPNLVGYLPAKYDGPTVSGPRLAVSDLDDLGTFDFGDIPSNTKVSHDFRLKNVGDADLVITQVHASCGCTVPEFAGRKLDKDGKLDPPLTLKPGEEEILSVTYDPQVLKDSGKISKFIQIFTNDMNGRNGELRFQIVGNVVEP